VTHRLPRAAARSVSPVRRSLLAGGALLLTGLAGCDRLGLGSSEKTFNGVDITGADYGARLLMSDIEGRPRSLSEFRGKVVVVFFGYTQCPDVCPLTMAELAEVKRSIGAEGQRIQGIFVTVDPERDTPEVLKGYMSGFDPDFIALRGTPEQTAALAKEFKVFFAKVPGKRDDSYTVDHTAGSYVFDPSGRLRLFVRHGSGAQALKSDLEALLRVG
jgi:protein SCO1